MQQQLGLFTCSVLAWALLSCLPSWVLAAAPAVAINATWPSSVSLYVQTNVRVTLNASACSQQGQDALEDAQLVLQQVTAKGGSLAFRRSTASYLSGADRSSSSSNGGGDGTRGADCTAFDFPVLLDSSSRHGNITARLLLPRAGISLQLQEPINVFVPLLLSVRTPVVNVTTDQDPFTVGVALGGRAPAGGVSVRLQLEQPGAAKVEPEAVFWPEGAAGGRNFSVALLAAPEGGVLTARLVSPTGGAVLQPKAATVRVLVRSPTVAVSRNLGYYRGMNGSSMPRLSFTLTGSSAFPVEFAYSTFLLPGSRPSLLPCHPLAPACSVADQEAVNNVTTSGSRYITPGQRGIPPVYLPITWGRLPPEAELRVGVRVTCLSNCRAADQSGDVAAIIFGTPLDHCPPGAVQADTAGDLSSGNSRGDHTGQSSSSDRPTYTHVAALQELALVLDTDPASSSSTIASARNADGRRLLSAAVNSPASSNTSAASNSTSGNWRSKNATSTHAKSRNSHSSPPSKAAGVQITASVKSVMPDANSSDSSSTLDLDPPFRPLVDRYIALLPPGPSSGQLMLSSSRWGDVVVVDTTACGELDSERYTVSWDQDQQLWREYYPLAGQKTPCWIRVHIFTRLADGTTPPAPHVNQQPERGSRTTEPSLSLKDPSAAGTTPAGSAGRHPLQTQPQGASASSNAASSGARSQGTGGSNSSNGSGNAVLNDSWSSSSNGSTSNTASSSPSVWDLPSDFVLYRSYTIRFVPLRPPEQLSLRAITFSNNATTVIACGIPQAWEHLFVRPKTGQQAAAAAQGQVRLSSIMSSNYAAASSRVVDSQRMNSSRGSNSTGSTAVTTGDPQAAVNSSFRPLSPQAEVATGQASGPSTSSSSSSSAGAPPALTAAPGVDVQVAYLVMRPAGSNGSTASQDVAAATKLPQRLRLQQFSVLDRVSNHTVIWSRFTAADCPQDRYILLPMAQLKPDMKMVPELLDPEGFAAGVKIAMSAAAVALPGGVNSNSSTSSTGSSVPDDSTSRSSHLGVPSDGSTSVSSWLLGQKFQDGGFGGSPAAAAAAAAAVDGGRGYGGAGRRNLGDEVWCGSTNSSVAKSVRGVSSDGLSSSSSGGSNGGCRLQLPGLTAELPIILTADEGRSSKTYTMLLYSNATAAAAVHDLILPQEAAAASSRGSSSSSGKSQAADAAVLSAAFFANRPSDWPVSPAQSSQCSVCPNGTYSTKTDSLECKVCPPGKYAASPFSTTCLYCPPGTFSYYWGAPTCRTCLPGTYAAAAGSLFCDICRDGTTTRFEGATQCEVTVAGGPARLDDAVGSADVAILLSFGLLLDGTNLEAVSRSLTGINGSSEGIVGVLVRGDTASALNISLGSVQVLAVQQIGSRQLLVNVSAALPVSKDQAAAAAAAQQDLSADPLIQRLIDDPNTFLRTTQTLGAESASVQDFTTQMTQRARWRHHLQLHAILWPTLVGFLLLMGLGSWGWRRRRRRQLQLAQMAGGRTEQAASVAVGGFGGLFGTNLQQRGSRGGNAAAGLQQQGGGWGSRVPAASAAAPGPGWFYGDGFMSGGAAGATAGSLVRVSVNSRDGGDGAGRPGGPGWSGTLRHLHRLLTSRVRIVLKVRGSNGAVSPVSSCSPDRSSCSASEADSMERGVDELRVNVLVGGSDGGSASGGHACSSCCNPRHHARDLDFEEESFAARLRLKQQQQQQMS